MSDYPKSVSDYPRSVSDYKPLILNALETLRKKDTAEKRVFQARAYKKIIDQLKTMEKPVHTIEDLSYIEGAGQKIKDKFVEILETGSLRAAEKAKAEYPIELYDSLQNIYGVGPVKAKDLVEKEKIKSIADLRTKVAKNPKLLNENQMIGLQYYEDINERIPRKEMTAHAKLLMASLPPTLEGTIVGSYRRQAETSGDIDMLLKGSDGFKEYIATLKQKHYILETLAEGDKKCLAISKLTPCSKGRRLDLLVTPKEEYAYAILYFTGSDMFNVAMRRYALTLGYSLNEHTMTPTKPDVGLPPDMETEQDIFQFLGLQYIEPQDRKGEANIIPLPLKMSTKVRVKKSGTRKAKNCYAQSAE
jgi:DNA polymerase/3'-5' exonuclease PolX